MDIEFAEYLAAKFGLDERSLNRDVRRVCFERLRGAKVLRCLDVGTGTGAMVRRLAESGLVASLFIAALDRDPELLRIASNDLAESLARRCFQVRVRGNRIDAEQAARRICIEFQCCDLLDFQPHEHHAYDLVTAHSVMDIVPMASALSRFNAWLANAGLFYATLNYDGDTAVFPRYRDEDFEAALLGEYDASMERRRVHGEPTGGARSGRRLHALLSDAGFAILAYGSSDWNITPLERRYRDRDDQILRTLLATIRSEGERHPGIARDRLLDWHGERMCQLETRQLGMIVHQIDVVATKSGAPQDFVALT